MGDNTLRALASDHGHLAAWCRLTTGSPPLLLKFVVHHLWDPGRRAEAPSHGMPVEVVTSLGTGRLLRADGPHAFATLRRRLTSWSSLTRWRGLTGAFGDSSFKSALRFAVARAPRPRQGKSKKAVAELLSVCPVERSADLRDQALLVTAFTPGGRRRSEVAALHVEDLLDEEPIPPMPAPSPSLPLNPSRPHENDDE